MMVIETYYRKRSKKAQHNTDTNNNPLSSPELDPRSQNLNEEGGEDKAQMRMNHITIGRLYEIDHIHLPPRTPVQLRSIRVAMVVEKTDVNVSVRYPSMDSLRAFFCYTTRQTHPALDEKFVMGKELAGKVLCRMVSTEMYSEEKSLESFWLMTAAAEGSETGGVVEKKGGCLSALKSNGVVGWGVRKQVKYLGRHKDQVDGLFETEVGMEGEDESEEEEGDDEDGGGNGVENGVEEDEEGEGEESEGGSEDEEKDDAEEEEEELEEEKPLKKKRIAMEIDESNILKRKRIPLRNTGCRKKQKTQRIERKKKQQQKKKKKMKMKIQPKKQKKNTCKDAMILRNPKDRWSSERYKLAEQNLLDVMRAKGATAEKPLLRPQLRVEARKFIGDTGLLDHLLKHMAGKLAPGGDLRFRRRHNADGAMEYWLESADLVNIRKEAGVTDPFWIPPPGWKPGDSPTQDPVCGSKFKTLEDENSKMKCCLEELKGEIEELRRERADQSQAIVSVPSCFSQKLEQLASLVSTKSESEKEQCKDLLMGIISDVVKGIEEKFGQVTPVQISMEESALIVPAEASVDKEIKQSAGKGPESRQMVQALMRAEQELVKDQSTLSLAAEQKAAKIQRLKSGFRICKPQGTFLWPNMAKNTNSSSNNNMAPPQVTVQVEVPTPPSVSSSTAYAPPQLPYHPQYLNPPPSPVKPLAERRAVTVTVSTVSKGHQNYHEGDGSNNYSSTTTAMINLNEAPTPNPNPSPLLSSITASTRPWEAACYEQRNAMGYDDQRKHNNACCSSSASCLASEVANWLALSTIKSASDESSHGS